VELRGRSAGELGKGGESGGEGAVQPRSGGGLCRGAWRIEGAKDSRAERPWLSVSRYPVGSQ
jgi:hypothetical protein